MSGENDERIIAGRRAWVHLHIPSGRYSVKYSGQPVFYVDAVHMIECAFHTNERLREIFEARPSRRTVHSHVVGKIVAFAAHAIGGSTIISCNPFKYRLFTRVADGVPVRAAREVMLHPGGRIEAVDAIPEKAE